MKTTLGRLLYRLASPSMRALANRRLRASYDLNKGPPMAIETAVDAAALDRMWDHIAEVWSRLGDSEPLWSVLTNDRYLSKTRPTPETVAGFYDSGRGDRDYLLAFLARAGLSPAQFPILAEYGCGVGRTTRWLAATFTGVKAFDVSAPHLAMARQHLAQSGLANVDFVHLQQRDDLGQLAGIDLFFSLIVLQHNPPPVILDILDRAFAALNPGGVAFFQVPTYREGYRFSATGYWQDVASRTAMEIHFVPQAAIFDLAGRHGLRLLEVRNDNCLGSSDSTISNTFLMRKGPLRAQ